MSDIRRFALRAVVSGLCAGTVASIASAATPAADVECGEAPVTVGVVAYLSGPFASTFGLPARHAAELMIDALNAGSVPEPHDVPGFGGAPLALTLVDEAGGPERQIDQYRQLVERQNVDLVIGYASDHNCRAVTPLSGQLRRLTVFSDCGEPEIFGDRTHRYLFRTGSMTTMDSAAAALYVAEMVPGAKSVAGLNEDRPSSSQSWDSFQSVLRSRMPAIRVGASMTPASPDGAYEAEIAVLRNADVVHSSLWGSRAEAFLRQGVSWELFRRSTIVMTAGESAVEHIDVPDGTIVRASGPFAGFAVDTPLQRWFQRAYRERFASGPNAAAYKMARAILGAKSAWEQAQSDNAGKRPSQEQVIAAFEHLRFEGPDGTVAMDLGKGHQAAHGTAYGRTRRVDGQTTLVDVRHYSAVDEPHRAGSQARAQ